MAKREWPNSSSECGGRENSKSNGGKCAFDGIIGPHGIWNSKIILYFQRGQGERLLEQNQVFRQKKNLKTDQPNRTEVAKVLLFTYFNLLLKGSLLKSICDYTVML